RRAYSARGPTNPNELATPGAAHASDSYSHVPHGRAPRRAAPHLNSSAPHTTPGRSPTNQPKNSPPELGIERVAQAFAEQVEHGDREEDREARVPDQVGHVLVHVLLALLQDLAPGGGGRRHA